MARPRAIDPDPQEHDGEEPAEQHPSRSARKRHAAALQRLGVQLTYLKPAQLQGLALPEPLLQAVLEAQRLRSRAALARQQQYIGKLMRQVDPEPIERVVNGSVNAKLSR